MIFPIMVADEIILRGSYINASFCRSIHLVSFLISDSNSTTNKSLSFFQDRPRISGSFSFMPNCCFAKPWSVSFTITFLSKAETFECHLWSLKPTSWNTYIAVSFNDATCSKFLPPAIRLWIYRSSCFSTISAEYFYAQLLGCSSIGSFDIKGDCTKPKIHLVKWRPTWFGPSFGTQ